MIVSRLSSLLVAVALTGSGVALASDIYRWTDADGSVHYGDRPSGAPTEQRLTIASNRTDSAAVQARTQARREARAARNEAAAGAPQEKTREELRAEREERAQQCQQHRDRLESYLQSQRLYRENASGEREYLDEQEILDARAAVQEKIQEYCN